MRLVRYHDLRYELGPDNVAPGKIVKVRVLRSIGVYPFRVTRVLRAYRLKCSPWMRTPGFRWVESGKFTPGFILERIEVQLLSQTEHLRLMLDSELNSAPAREPE